MVKKVIDGKTYIELSKLQILIWLIFVLLVIMFSYLLFYVHDNIEALQNNPLSYGVDLYNFMGCTCNTKSGDIWYVNASSVFSPITNNQVLFGPINLSDYVTR